MSKRIKHNNKNGLFNINININVIKGLKDSLIKIYNGSESKKQSSYSVVEDVLHIKDFQSISTKIDYYYRERFYDKPNIHERDIFPYDVLTDKTSLLEALEEHNLILLLGNAGVGKTTELKHVFNAYWEKKEENKIYPIYINLKSFRGNSKIVEHIKFKDWQLLPKVLFIFDGLDEAKDVEDIESEIKTFVNQNESDNIKFLISCRTNIYDKYLLSLANFSKLYLEPLTFKEIEDILKNGYSISLDFKDIYEYRQYLENPFHLGLFANYYKTHDSFPSSKAEMWEIITEKEIDELFVKKAKKRFSIDKFEIEKIIKKVAIINELQQINTFSLSDYSKILNSNERNVFIELPFVIKDSDEISFIHRNYQEFFASKYLSQLPHKKVIDIIQIEGTGKTKPYLFNVLSFLLNLWQGEKSRKLVDWMVDNNNDAIFSIEVNKIDVELRNNIFQKYFERICIENTFWISDNRNIELKNLAKFANYEYLISVITNSDFLFRIIESALIILRFSDIPPHKISELKETFLKLLQSSNLDSTKQENTDNQIKAEILRCIQEKSFHENDRDYFNIIYSIFKQETDKELNHSLLNMIKDFDIVDDYFEFIEHEIQLRYNIKERNRPNDVHYGFEFLFEKIISKIKNENNFLKCINYLYHNDFNNNFNNRLISERTGVDKLISVHKTFFERDSTHLNRVIDIFIAQNRFHTDKDDLDKIIESTNSEEVAFNYLIEKIGFSFRFDFLLVRLFQKGNIGFISEQYEKNKLSEKDIEHLPYFRNFLLYRKPNNGRELAENLTQTLKMCGYTFPEPLITTQQLKKNKQDFLDFSAYNFNLVFDKETLLTEIKKVFEQFEKEEITDDEIGNLQYDWNIINHSYHSLINTIYTTISKLMGSKKSISYDKIESLLKSNFNQLRLIKEKLEERLSIQIANPKQIQIINTLCNLIISEMTDEQFENVITENRPQERSCSFNEKNYYLFDHLFYFDRKFKEVSYPKEFHIKTLRYSGLFSRTRESNLFEHIRRSINSELEFKTLVIQNLKTKDLDFHSLENHCQYILDEKIYDLFPFVEDKILNNIIGLYPQKFLQQYIELINYDNDFLKKSTKDISSHFCWEVIRIYLKNGFTNENEIAFIKNVALAYIELKNPNHINTSLDILFYTNHKSAIEIYWKLISNDLLKEQSSELTRRDYEIKYFSNYFHLTEMESLSKIFFLIYGDNRFRDFYMSRNFLINIVSHLSTTKKGYSVIHNMLQEIRQSLDAISQYTEFYYVNQLIQTVENSYINSLIELPSLEESIKLVKEFD